MAAAQNTRARKARSVPHRVKRYPAPDSAAGILSAVRLRLKFVMAAAFTISAALQFQNADLDAEMALMVGRCVGDEIDEQIEEIDRVIAKLLGGRRAEARE
jgi:hypothetical protein